MRALTGLLHRFPEHDMSRCQLVASLLLTIWQLGGETFSPSPPSFVLVNANEEKDAVWQALTGILRSQLAPIKATPNEPEPFNPNNIFRGNPVMSRRTMLAAIATRAKLVKQRLPPHVIDIQLKKWLADWHQCKPEVFPALEINHYNKAHDPDFGWVTQADDHISLLIHGPKSEAELRRDLQDKQSKLHIPQGVCDDLSRGNKKLALIGRITGESWDTFLVDGLLGGPFARRIPPPPVSTARGRAAPGCRHPEFHGDLLHPASAQPLSAREG
ncbi:hypothetical protein OKA04_18245 [Luteolibacter flavescens]|uniref:Uncharacterized protein n=1 Tax=Luteolibacter flavescens TaxID=1859460 RepID=A0ABT3FSY2_9BACT|nr:hypothetical protein [Luteolibacter flavescens]MCW1886685.1 hypothetical protein [Luteolibacter flavescens]